MVEASGKFKVEKVISYSDDLLGVFKDKKDLNYLAQCLHHFTALRSSTDTDLNQAQSSLREYEKKVDECKKKTEAAKSEVVSDEELDLLQSELDGDVELESLLMEELRVIRDEINDLERQRVAQQEKKRIWERREQEEIRKLKKLSMYASVTNVIPTELEDHSGVLGYVVDSEKKTHQKFEFDPTKMTAFETCNCIWKIIS